MVIVAGVVQDQVGFVGPDLGTPAPQVLGTDPEVGQLAPPQLHPFGPLVPLVHLDPEPGPSVVCAGPVLTNDRDQVDVVHGAVLAHLHALGLVHAADRAAAVVSCRPVGVVVGVVVLAGAARTPSR